MTQQPTSPVSRTMQCTATSPKDSVPAKSGMPTTRSATATTATAPTSRATTSTLAISTTSAFENSTMTNSTTTTQPKPEYFTTATAHSGIVLNHKTVYGYPTRKSKTQVWRVWVRIRTTEGWNLMGYIGNANAELALPSVKKGDRVELDPLVLSDWKRVEGRDERPKDFARTLTGKILRPSGVAVGPAYTAPNSDFSDFDMPPVFALINPDSEYATIFVPSPWNAATVLTRSMTRDADGIWRWSQGCGRTKEDARALWNELIEMGCTPRDVIKEPLNDDSYPSRPEDRFATNFAMSTTCFADLVRVNKGYPRKPIA